MSKRLRAEDDRVVDTLLDRINWSGGDGNCAPPADGQAGFVSQVSSDARVRAAEKILSLLDHLPADEPPADLVERTLLRVEQAQPQAHASPAPPPYVAPPSVPPL